MKRAIVLRHLEQVDRHVATGAAIIERQRELIARARNNGTDIAEFELLLTSFETAQALHIADRERLRRELASLAE